METSLPIRLKHLGKQENWSKQMFSLFFPTVYMNFYWFVLHIVRMKNPGLFSYELMKF